MRYLLFHRQIDFRAFITQFSDTFSICDGPTVTHIHAHSAKIGMNFSISSRAALKRKNSDIKEMCFIAEFPEMKPIWCTMETDIAVQFRNGTVGWWCRRRRITNDFARKTEMKDFRCHFKIGIFTGVRSRTKRRHSHKPFISPRMELDVELHARFSEKSEVCASAYHVRT